MKIQLYLQSVTVNGPGFESWSDLKNIFDGEPLLVQPTTIPAVKNLSSTESRRVTKTIKLAMGVAQTAFDDAHLVDKEIASIFATSSGDSEIMDYLGCTLAKPGRPISPTKFHNSLHNAPSGYWSIAQGSHKSKQALIAANRTFAIGLIESVLYCNIEKEPALLVSYDIKPPEKLADFIPIKYDFAAAFVFAPNKTEHSIAGLCLEIVPKSDDQSISIPDKMNSLIEANFIAECIPLLLLIHQSVQEPIYLDYSRDQAIKISHIG